MVHLGGGRGTADMSMRADDRHHLSLERERERYDTISPANGFIALARGRAVTTPSMPNAQDQCQTQTLKL